MLIDISLFGRNRNFTCLYIGQFVSFLGTMITGVALPYQIYMQTHSTLWVGLLSLAQLLPLLITALAGGVLADRSERRRLLLGAEIILSSCTLLLAFNVMHNHHQLIWLFTIAMIMSAINGLHRPALDSIVQQIVAKKDFATVSALGTFKYSLGMIIGPAIGGLLIAHGGLVLTYLVDFLSFVISLIALLAMTSIPKPTLTAGDSVWRALKQGLSYATSRQELIGSYSVDFVAMIFGMPTALFPAVAMQMGGVKVLGALYAAPAIGALAIALLSGWVRNFSRYGKMIAISAIGWGISIVGFGLVKEITAAIFFLALAGGFDALSGIYRGMLWNETIPNHFRGRLAGLEMLSYISGPKLGDTEAGLVAAGFGVTTSIVSGGVLCVIAVALCCWQLPKFWYYRTTLDEGKI